jgi:hypothetical protein
MIMTSMTTVDWDALQSLAGRVGLPTERINVVRRRLEPNLARPGSPYTLLVGRPNAGIELLLARWLRPEAAEALQTANDHPLVIGATPDQAQPRLGGWPMWKCSQWQSGHLIVWRTSAKPTADKLAQLSSLGYCEQMVLVTRLGQPLHAQERELARALAGLSATGRVLVVGTPGEEPTQADLAQVVAYAVNLMRRAGFNNGRCLGADVWFTGDSKPLGTTEDVGRVFSVDQRAVATGRTGMVTEVLSSLLSEIRQLAAHPPCTPQAVIAEEECQRLSGELTKYLADLGRELQRQAHRRQPMTAAILQTYALDALRGWGAYTGIEGHWLKYIERLRPGTQVAFLAKAHAVMPWLEYEPRHEPKKTPHHSTGSPLLDRLIVEAKRLGDGLLSGMAAYLLCAALLGSQTGSPADHQGAIALPGMIATWLSYAALGVGGVLGYGVSCRGVRVSAAEDQQASTLATSSYIRGWQQVERQLLAWFSEHIRRAQVSPLEECGKLAEQLGIKEEDR